MSIKYYWQFKGAIMKNYFLNTLPFWIARKLPKRIIYFAYITLHAHVTCNEFSNKIPDEVTWSQALDSYCKDFDLRI